MNYLLEVIAFNEWAELNEITTSSFRLWHALMDYNNKFGWSEWFTVPIVKLQLKTGMERSTIYNARNQLVQLGRIKCESREGRQSAKYNIMPISGHYLAHNLDTTLHTKATQTGHNAGLLTKPKYKPKTKTKESTDARFKAPGIDDVKAYCRERGNVVDAEKFIDHYTSNGWRVGKNGMKDWKAAVRTWEKSAYDTPEKPKNPAFKVYESDAKGVALMENAFDIMMGLLKPALDVMPITDDDYQGDDGMVYCAKCKTRKQMWIDLLGEKVKVKVLCECQEEAMAKEEQAAKQRKQKEIMAETRSAAIESAAWQACCFEQDDQRDKNASRKAVAYADNFDKMLQTDTGLLLYGGLGSGKTFLAACIANQLLDEGRRVMMTNLSSLIANINVDFGAEREYWMTKVTRAQLLVLDDFGVERATGYSMEQSYEIINARYKTGKPLLITTNLTLQEMQSEANLGKRRIYDRVVEKCIPLLVQGDSRRVEIAKMKRQEAMEILEDRE